MPQLPENVKAYLTPRAREINPAILARQTLYLPNQDAWTEVKDALYLKTGKIPYILAAFVWHNRLILREKIGTLARQRRSRVREGRQYTLLQAIDPTGKKCHPRRWLRARAIYADALDILGSDRIVMDALREAREHFYGLRPSERAELFGRTVREVAIRLGRPAPQQARLPWHED